MTNRPETIERVEDTFAVAGRPTIRSMMGGHLIYLDGVLVGQINDDAVFLKPTAPTSATYPDIERRSPYPGAKPALVITHLLDETDRLKDLLVATHEALAGGAPKRPRRRRT